MVTDYKKIDLFGKTLLQKLEVKSPYEFEFPVSDYACFIFSLEGEIDFRMDEDGFRLPHNYSLLLNCMNKGKRLASADPAGKNEIVVISFHPDVLKKIYDREVPLLLQKPVKQVSNQSAERIDNDFLIKKYIEGLLFYFENPSLVSEEMLILKLKEILLLLSQTKNAETIQVILSQLFSPLTYTFREVIEANLFEQLSVEDLAKKTNLSVSSFKREFAKLYNESPAKYIRTRRLEKAAELLRATDQRITDIALDCGFNDLANFTKSFHEEYGITPTNYRSQART
ncbi:MAG: AraC family transcriptional regulator [Chitinophagaceae bacterium]|nr:MAG: AraC family transcriptional regulator [Chitinophagaceae bacterium]